MNQKYNLVDTKEKLKQLDSILMDGNKPRYKILSYDTETNGLALYRSTVVGFSLSFDDNSGYYIPLLIWEPNKKSLKKGKSYKKVKYDMYLDGRFRCNWTGEYFDEFVTPKEYDLKNRIPFIPAFIKRWLSNVKLIMHNAPFDINMTYINSGVDLKNSLLLDTSLLLHVLDENERTGLKRAAERYRVELGINPKLNAAQEKKELDTSIIQNGGTPGQVWRASLEYQSKYACADTFLTFGLYKVLIKDFSNKFGKSGLEWFFNKEVMPVCKEVVVDMKRNGVYIDLPYFKKIHKEIQDKMMELEDYIMNYLDSEKLLDGFNIGKSVEEEISKKAFILELIRLQNKKVPTTIDKKTGEEKETISKTVVKKIYQEDPHWLWGYILGEDELRYSDSEIKKIKKDLYVRKMNKDRISQLKPLKRYRFNINSGDHLIWLFCEKLGLDKKSLPQTDSATPDKPRPSMDAETIETYILPKFPWTSKLLSYKKLLKLESTYIRPALLLNVDSWLYVDMKQNGTTSGRFSCSGGYNLQTLPRVEDENESLNSCDKCFSERFNKDGTETGLIKVEEVIECMANRKCLNCGDEKLDIARPSAIKKGFIAPPGYKIVNADYSSLEPRCFAYVSGENAIKDVYRNNLDLYSQVYCELLDHNKQYSADPKSDNFLKKVAPEKRKMIKPLVLGIPYGSGDAQVANMVGAYKTFIDRSTGKEKERLDVQEGKRLRDLYLNRFSNLNKYMDEQDLRACTDGFVETIIGRRRHLKYAKEINNVLVKNNISFLDLSLAPKKQLAKKTTSYVSERGVSITLTEDMLYEIANNLGIKNDKLAEKNYWVYIRALLKAELNNAKNYPIQGLAGSITNKGMLETTRYFKKHNLDAWVMLQIHDEISCYAREDHADKAAELLRSGMENNEFTDLIDVKMIADPIICDNLKEAK